MEDGGAIVRNWKKKQLHAKSPRQIREEIEFIFSDPECVETGQDFFTFETRQLAVRLSNPVLTLSYFYLFARVFRPNEEKMDWKQVYDIKNQALMSRLHPKGTLKRQPHAYVQVSQARKR